MIAQRIRVQMDRSREAGTGATAERRLSAADSKIDAPAVLAGNAG